MTMFESYASSKETFHYLKVVLCQSLGGLVELKFLPLENKKRSKNKKR